MKLKLIILSLLSFSILLYPGRALAVNCANPTTSKEIVACGACNSASENCIGNPEKDVQGTLTTVLNWLSVIIGVVAVVMIIFAGFRYITSGGSQEKIKGAKDTLLYAVIGLVIVALAQIMVKFVINSVNNNDSNSNSSNSQPSTPSGSGKGEVIN